MGKIFVLSVTDHEEYILSALEGIIPAYNNPMSNPYIRK